MRQVLNSRKHHHVARVSVFLVTVAFIAGMVGCVDTIPSSQNLEIRNWCDLDDIRNNLGANHALMNDLDAATAGYEELASPTANQGKGWRPIGTRESQFTGSFDGQGREISDLFINRPDEDDVGLFGIVDEGGLVENIGVVKVAVTGGNNFIGGLMGANYGTVSSSYSTGNVTGSYSVGGLVGANAGPVSDCYSTASVNGDIWVGGLVGQNDGYVSDSYSTGNVFGLEEVGSLVGKNNDDCTVSNSYSTGNVTGGFYVGGLVGLNDEGSVTNSFWDTETSGQDTSDGGTGKSTAEVKSIATFSDAGWSITAVASPDTRNPSYTWNIVDGQTYPFLSWQPVS